MKGIVDLAFFAPMVLCIGIAGSMAFYDRSGWGWFLLAAAIFVPSRRSKNEDAEDEADS